VYEAFFSLEDPPFVLTPDPRFLLRARGHHEILSSLIHGITSEKGLMALIGDVGTGKTTLCRALVRDLPKDVQSALVLNPFLSGAELVGAIMDDLGVERRGSTAGELVAALGRYLLAAGAEGKTVVVIVDEAQQMSVEALEQVRILSTIETATRKLLQIVLVGQPELEDKLGRWELRQLDQRIRIRCYLKPLSARDTYRYVEHRLRIAGLPGALPFTRGALARVYRHSRGTPRVINLVSDRALLAAFTAGAREVTPDLVKVAVRNLAGERRARRGWRAARPLWRAAPIAATILGFLLLGGAAATAYRSGWRPLASPALSRGEPAGRGPAQPVAVTTGAVAAATPPPPAARPAPSAAEPGAPASEDWRVLLAQVLALWGVKEEHSEQAVKAWPVSAGGVPDVPAVAERYHLAATRLGDIDVADLRAIGLPAIVEVHERSGPRPLLVRRFEGDTAVLTAPAGEEARVRLDSLEASWTRSAWIIWNDVDHIDYTRGMTPAAVRALAARLRALGYLTPPLPTTNNGRLQQAVRRFQSAVGFRPDGVVGLRTILALSRVSAGPASASVAAAR